MRKIWRRTSAAVGAACVVVLAAGCAGGPPTPQVGATQAQVEAQLGTPKATFPLPDGGWVLNELELIEAAIFITQRPKADESLAAALVARL